MAEFFAFLGEQAVGLADAIDSVKILGDMSLLDFAFVILGLDIVFMFLYIKGGGDNDT